jgi:hypothetical protein
MSYLKDREIWLSSVPTGNPPAGYVWVFIQNGVFVVRDSSGVDKIMASTTGTVTNATSASYVEYSNVADKPALISSSAQVSYTGLSNIPAGIVSGSAQIAGYNVFATTGSNQFNGSQAITGSLTVTGQVIAQTLNVQQVTSSIVFSSGSNIFGNDLGNTQQFTGSVSVTGSLTVVTAGTELQVTSTGVNLGNIVTDNHNVTGSLRVSGSMALNGALTGTSATFRVSADRNLATRFDTNIVLSAQSDTAAPESLRIYADTFRLFTATTAGGLTERLTISNTGIATFTGQTVAANGSVNIESADPAIRFRYTGGTANSRIYEWRAVAAGGVNDIMQLRLWNDAQSSASTLFTVSPTGAGIFSSSVTAQGGKSQLIASGGASAGSGISLNTGLSGADRRNWFIGTEETVAGDFQIKCSTAAGGVGGSGDTRLAILNNGNVGIGATNPSGRLHIVNTSGLGQPVLELQQQNANSNIVQWRGSAGTYLGIISDVGNMGIGATDTSNHKLYVQGNLRMSGSGLVRTFFAESTTLGAKFDVFRFLNDAGSVFATAGVSGILFLNAQDTATSGNQISYTFHFQTNGNGTSQANLTQMSFQLRGTQPITSIGLENDGGGGAVKVVANVVGSGVSGCRVNATFVGVAI